MPWTETFRAVADRESTGMGQRSAPTEGIARGPLYGSTFDGPEAPGPRSVTDLAQAVINGKRRQLGDRSKRQVKADLAEIDYVLGHMDACRQVMNQVAYLDIPTEPNTSGASPDTTP
jgi:hypothetical protein